jgi:hypothetical protein
MEKHTGSNEENRMVIPEERPLTEPERSLLEWSLRHGKPEAAQFFDQLPLVTVISRCGCGCPTIDLGVGGKAASIYSPSLILADFIGGTTPRGGRVGVVVHAREGLLSELEIYSLGGEGKILFPHVEDLHPLEFE